MGYEIGEDNYLAHIGVIERSGRYPWGSGDDPYQRLREFRGIVSRMRKEGKDDGTIATYLGFETQAEFRNFNSIYNHQLRRLEVEQAENLKKKAWSTRKIADKMGISEGKVRTLLKPSALRETEIFEKDLEFFKSQVDAKGMVDVSTGVESQIKITKDQKERVLTALEELGYHNHTVWEKHGKGIVRPVNVLTKPEISDRTEVFKNVDKVKPLVGDADSYDMSNPLGIHEPLSIDPKRLQVIHGDAGGDRRDGVMYIRPGVKDLSLGDSTYAQVRIRVGEEHFLKGMALYKKDLPEGVDIQFYTPKGKTGDDKLSALKKMNRTPSGELDLENPFGSIVNQIKETGPDGKVKVTSAMNIVNEEDDWDGWSRNLATQFLSKQSTNLARSQLELTRANRKAELEEILELENPVVKRYMLDKFADSSDAAAVHMKAAALPRQKTHVILPIDSLKDNEVYARNYENGEEIVLVRYPHGGTFELPRLVVNNKNKEGIELIGEQNKVALGINSRVAEQLSGADFDGDTVVAIPDNSGRIKTKAPLPALESFDAKRDYGPPPGFDKEKDKPPYKLLQPKQVGREMGGISNLITDMQLKGASDDEIARAVKHSMVVIDAEKHSLDYTRSAKENRITELKEAYQGGARSGASTIISRASAQETVDERKPRLAEDGGPIDKTTGEKVYVPTGRLIKKYPKVDGKKDYTAEPTIELATHRSKKMAETDDARTLLSDDPAPMEVLYATHANEMKALANTARLERLKVPRQKRDPEAYKKYAAERASLDAKLELARANAPREREAKRLADKIYKIRVAENPEMDDEQKLKIRRQSLENARNRTGSNKSRLAVVPDEREWEAIQNYGISESKLEEVLSNGHTESIVKLATPKKQRTISTSQISRMKAMAASGYSQAEIAKQLGISTSTVNKHL